MALHRGSCHCGRVCFEVEAPAELEASACNCSICAKLAYLHVFVHRQRFRLLQGEDALRLYTWGTRTAQHLFCSTCGVKSFYVPRSHPEGYSVNALCLDSETVAALRVTPFDGAHWEENVHRLRPLDPG